MGRDFRLHYRGGYLIDYVNYLINVEQFVMLLVAKFVAIPAATDAAIP